MPPQDTAPRPTASEAPQVALPCLDLEAMLAFLTGSLGFRLEMIAPADAPVCALVSAPGLSLRLERVAEGCLPAVPLRLRLPLQAMPQAAGRQLSPPPGLALDWDQAPAAFDAPAPMPELLLWRAGDGAWARGRAGMHYRDLIPGRLGGRFIASHIRIPDGGSVPDYVHYHKVRFQMIFCRAGWVRVVYQDQGPPFVLHAGDCVLQPPEIRHRVLEASPGLEVIELACPAGHETWVEHGFGLPTPRPDPERRFGEQRFVRHRAETAEWRSLRYGDLEASDTGIGAATSGLAGVRVIRPSQNAAAWNLGMAGPLRHQGELLFLFVLRGELALESPSWGKHRLGVDDCCVLPAGMDYFIGAGAGLELLEVSLPACSGPASR